jgi:hypothetical protein
VNNVGETVGVFVTKYVGGTDLKFDGTDVGATVDSVEG